MVALRISRLGRVHYKKYPAATPDLVGAKNIALALGAEDGDDIVFVTEHAAPGSRARVEHFVAVVPKSINLVSKGDGPIEVAHGIGGD